MEPGSLGLFYSDLSNFLHSTTKGNLQLLGNSEEGGARKWAEHSSTQEMLCWRRQLASVSPSSHFLIYVAIATFERV